MSDFTFKPALAEQPLLNSIPENLLPRFDQTYVKYYNKYSAGRLATHQIPIEEYRKNPEKYTIAYGKAVAKDVWRVTTQKCPVEGGEISIRIYEPEPSDEARPVYVNYHGGGWVFGGLTMDAEFCKTLVNELKCVAFDVDYRLAPENKYPIPVDDSWAAFNWIRDHKVNEFNLDLNRVALGGISAGGQLSAVMALMARDANLPLAFQILAVPATDMDQFSPMGELKSDCPYESYREMKDTVPLPTARMEYFARHFLGTPTRAESTYNNWKVSPIQASNFKNLAPALVLTAEMDVLRDEGEAYAKKMNEAGSSAEVIRFKGAAHTFMHMDDILEGGKQYNQECLRVLRKAFGQ